MQSVDVICVDDDVLTLESTASMLEKHPRVSSVTVFSASENAVAWLKEHRAGIAFLDIHMGEMDGLALAKLILEKYPRTAVVFLTADPAFAVEAFRIHASGYILKPLTDERLNDEINHLLSGKADTKRSPHISVQTFGNFDLKVDGKTVLFSRSKAKELLAYLIDRQGSSITRAEAFAMLWEEGQYDRPMQKQLDVMIRSLRATLREAGIDEIMEMRNGTLRIRPELLDCDLYRFFEGDIEAVNAYRGEYMSAYSWASLTEAYMDRINKS